MNRVIKFRAWDKVAKKMTPHNFELFGEYLLVGALFSWQKEIRSDLKSSLDGLNDLVVMQFTGLLDKNGKECFDGDLSIINGILCRVRFGNYFTCGWDFEIINGLGCYPFYQVCKSFNNTGCKDFEIIGNIYSNPELLNQ